LTAEHIEAARQTMSKGQVGAIVQWPHGLRLEKGYDRFIVMAGRDSRDASEADEEVVPVCLLIPGITLFGQWQIVAERRRGRCTAGGPWHADLRLTTAIANLSIRPRRPGDRMRPLGAPGPRKLQDILVDCKVPRSERAGWPLVTSGNDILWAPGCAMAEDARVLSPEDEVLCLRALPIDGNNKLYGPLVDTRQSQ
jgi:tRNA(Ile)-lysidine synthase